MSWWMWYVPVGVVTALAYLYAKWSYRPRGPQEPNESVEAYERFRQVMAAPMPTQRTRRWHKSGAVSTRR
jgi:hypothetical protein